MLRTENATTEVRPCAPFTLPPGRYTAWLESDDFISGETWELSAGGESLHHVAPIVPAGTVLIEGPDLANSIRLKVYALGTVQSGFSRTVRRNEPVLMPAGQVIAVATDARERVVAVSRPERLAARGSRTLGLSTTRRILAARAGVPARDPATFSLFRDERVPPDVFVYQDALGIWYDLTEPTAVLGVHSSTLGAEPVQVDLSRRGVTYAALTLRRKPRLSVALQGEPAVPDSLRPIRIALIDETTKERLAEATLTDREHVFVDVEPRLVRCVLRTEAFTRTELVDLTTFADADVRFELKPIKVSGRVTLGRDPAPATITFRSETTIRAETDADGRYAATFWEEGKYSAEVRIHDPAVAPHRDLIDAYGEAVTVDFHVPKPSLAVRVIDDRTGDPILRAAVAIRNAWEDASSGTRAHVQTVFSDETGEAMLPGFRQGGVDVHVSATGYERAEPLQFTAGDQDELRRIEVRLKPLQSEALSLRLPDGSPASGARAFMIRADGQRLGATADGDGILRIPAELSGCLLLVKHSGFAHAQRWAADQHTAVLQGKGTTLLVKVQDRAGKPVRFAEMIVWIDGIFLTATGVAFLSDGHVSADGTGLWMAPNVPGVPLRIAASRPGAEKNLSTLLAIARDARPPWPPMVTVTAD